MRAKGTGRKDKRMMMLFMTHPADEGKGFLRCIPERAAVRTANGRNDRGRRPCPFLLSYSRVSWAKVTHELSCHEKEKRGGDFSVKVGR